MLNANLVDQIMDYENGAMRDEEQITFFQYLIASGLAWSLQGHYGRTADAMLHAGMIQARQ